MRRDRIGQAALSLVVAACCFAALSAGLAAEQEWWKPYSPPCVERENVFEFTAKPKVKLVGADKHEITFAVKGYCDVTVGIIDRDGKVVRHLASGVLGSNAPEPFQKNSLAQTLYWNGTDDLYAYPKESEKLRVRVMLGLKPEFDRHLGGTGPGNLAGWVAALAADENGVYVWSKGRTGRGREPFRIRGFDHDGKYLRTLLPPSSDLPEEKLGGYGYVEYEPGKRSLHGPRLYRSIMRHGFFHPETSLEIGGGTHQVFERASQNLRPQLAVSGGRMFFLTGGILKGGTGKSDDTSQAAATLHYLYAADGATEYKGLMGRTIGPTEVPAGKKMKQQQMISWFPLCQYRLAASPDGKWLYITGVCRTLAGFVEGGAAAAGGMPVVMRCATEGNEWAEVFVGELKDIGGSTEGKLKDPRGLDCDPQGRVYVADGLNSRIQIFAPDRKFLKSFSVSFPWWVGVHKKTGDVYVLHKGSSSKGKGDGKQLTKFSAFPAFEKLYTVDMTDLVFSDIAAVVLDSWSNKPRLWVGRARGEGRGADNEWNVDPFPSRLIVWEENGKGLRKCLDFDEAARQEEGPAYCCPWIGSVHQNNLTCDPTSERFYWRLTHIFDLTTGRRLGHFLPPDSDLTAISPFNYRGLSLWDAWFCKRGYMHVAFKDNGGQFTWTGTPGGRLRGVMRLAPFVPIAEKGRSGDTKTGIAECPYDYGESPGGPFSENSKWLKGVLEVPDQCYRPWSLGLGVNMVGDIATAQFISYAPKLESSESGLFDAYLAQYGAGLTGFTKAPIRRAQLDERETHHIKRGPGIPLRGPTVWTFEHTGQIREKDAVISGACSIHGLGIDEAGKLYFACSGVRVAGGTREADGTPFLAGRGGNYGGASPYDGNRSPLTGSYMKTRGSNVRFITQDKRLAPVPLEEYQIPNRHHDLLPSEARNEAGHMDCGIQYGEVDSGSEQLAQIGRVWVEGAEWIYAGCSPESDRECYCAQSRPHLDWYKRSFVLEMYRHSFGALDTNGNLILHFGRYGNRDDAMEATGKGRAAGGDGVTICYTDQIAGTDNYLVYCDYGERLVVLKINYHAEETVPLL